MLMPLVLTPGQITQKKYSPKMITIGCPNCGSTLPFSNSHCISCWWGEGEEFFRPTWMPEKEWRAGQMTHWMPRKKKKPEPPLSEMAQLIMKGIEKTGG